MFDLRSVVVYPVFWYRVPHGRLTPETLIARTGPIDRLTRRHVSLVKALLLYGDAKGVA